MNIFPILIFILKNGLNSMTMFFNHCPNIFHTLEKKDTVQSLEIFHGRNCLLYQNELLMIPKRFQLNYRRYLHFSHVLIDVHWFQ